ncbi:MAG: galactokinase [Anaerolineaceae bacterium]
MPFYCYLVECSDGSFYTGWAKDPCKREKIHNLGKGAYYTSLRRPVRLVYIEDQPDISSVLRREKALKKLTHPQKIALITGSSGGLLMLKQALPEATFMAVAPGRVNLLGEHVDYNDGIVLPAAIDRTVKLNAIPTGDRIVTIEAIDLKQKVSFDLDTLDQKVDVAGKPLPGWAAYPAGVAWVLQRNGLKVSGMRAAFTSDVPIGAGLSSSAAVETAFTVLWQAIGGWELTSMQVARYSQEAENKYVGVNCGLMDQFASAHGVADHALWFDTRSLEWTPLPLPPQTVIIIADSGVRRSLTTSAYNDRRAACEEAVAILKKPRPEIHSLRDVTSEDLEHYGSMMPPVTLLRARHIVDEIERVEKAVTYLKAGDPKGFGQLMFECHTSLRDLYQVSCPELDELVEIAAKLSGCWGARLTGAGFGGCTVNLVKEDKATAFIKKLKAGYLAATGKTAEVYLCRASQGAAVKSI